MHIQITKNHNECKLHIFVNLTRFLQLHCIESDRDITSQYNVLKLFVFKTYAEALPIFMTISNHHFVSENFRQTFNLLD
jgi:hypothetical protein